MAKDSMLESSWLDGLVFCGECGTPLLSDGDGHICHIYDLKFKRLRALLKDESVALALFDKWLCHLEVSCPDCGRRHVPFEGLTGKEVVQHVKTKAGARDFYEMVQLVTCGWEQPTQEETP